MKQNYSLINEAVKLLYKVDQERKDFEEYADDFQEALETLEYIESQLWVRIARERESEVSK